MAIYYYNRYNVVEKLTEVVSGVSPGRWYVWNGILSSPLESSALFYPSYSKKSEPPGGYETTGTFISRSVGSKPVVGYYFTRGYSVIQVLSETRVYDGKTYHDYIERQNMVRPTRGSLIQTNIKAENSTYPSDGVHTNGYWYVRGSIVTPAIPSSISVPSTIKSGKPIIISWGSSDYGSYRLERQLDGGSWVEIYSGSLVSYNDIVPGGTITVAYRVRAYGNTQYSSYRASSVIEIKDFPELQMKVNGTLKTSDSGWVKVNGELREIDTMWAKINGALREVQ